VVVADFVPRGGVGAEHSGGHEPEPRTPAPLGLSRFGSAVCGYEHNGATHREMCLEPGQGWILCGPDVAGPTYLHYVRPSEGERVSLTFRYRLRCHDRPNYK
jgi:hypothetical protein